MIYISDFEEISYNKYKVGFIHYLPFNEEHGLGKSKEQLEVDGALIKTIPEPSQIEGKQAIMMYNTDTKEIYYEYEVTPQTEEDLTKQKIQYLEEENLTMKQSLAELAELIIEIGRM